MEARRSFKVACLSNKDAWELFRYKVGEETLNNHPLRGVVVCHLHFLPSADLWRARRHSRRMEICYSSVHFVRFPFPGLEEGIYTLVKFSYDSLPNDTITPCLLYCSLYPEDCCISKENLVDC